MNLLQQFIFVAETVSAQFEQFRKVAYKCLQQTVFRQVDPDPVAAARCDVDGLAGDLPGGYKQRLSMAAALLHEPKILFLDEPTSGIDPPARRIFWRQITALAAKGTTVIITTHFMDEAEYCDRIMIQDQGKMLILGTPEEVRNRGGKNLTMNEAFIAIVENSRRKEEL